jgi:hypothetical protein
VVKAFDGNLSVDSRFEHVDRVCNAETNLTIVDQFLRVEELSRSESVTSVDFANGRLTHVLSMHRNTKESPVISRALLEI